MHIVVGELCPSCQKFRAPAEMIQHPGYRECVTCMHRHEEALQSLATGRPPSECSECGTPWSELQARGDTRMACHMENGRYRLMCMQCDSIYVPKRGELYGPTDFGRSLGLTS
jgi:hypothetical protein